VNDGKLKPRAKKVMFLRLKRRVKGYKLWDSKDRKIILSGDITFNEAFMMKSPSFQQVEVGRPRIS